MITIFKDLKIWYFIVCGLIGAILAVTMIFMNIPVVIAVIIVLLWVLFWAMLFNRMAINRAGKIESYRDECNTKVFINKYASLLQNQKTGTVGDAVVRLNLAAGFLDLGDLKNAFNMLGKVQVPPSRVSGSNAVAATYHNDYSLAFLKAGNIQKAKEALDACKRILMDTKIPDKHRARYQMYCLLRQAQIDIVSLNESAIPRAEEAFKRYRASATTPLEEVNACYWLARIAYMKGDKEKEREYLNFAAINGGDSVYASEAKRILDGYLLEETLEIDESQ